MCSLYYLEFWPNIFIFGSPEFSKRSKCLFEKGTCKVWDRAPTCSERDQNIGTKSNGIIGALTLIPTMQLHATMHGVFLWRLFAKRLSFLINKSMDKTGWLERKVRGSPHAPRKGSIPERNQPPLVKSNKVTKTPFINVFGFSHYSYIFTCFWKIVWYIV